MQRQITRGASANAGLIFHIFAQDSTATDGSGKASVAFGSWSCRYIRNGESISGAITPEDITTIGTYAAPSANTNIRIKAVDNTNMIGIYEVQIHADWVNTMNSCQSLTIYLTASGVAVLPVQILLVGYNPQDGVRLGLTALPNAAAEAAGGLYTRGSGAGQINQSANGQVDVNAERLNNVAQSLLDLKDFADDGYDPATNKVQGVVLVDTTTAVTNDVGITQTGADKVWASAARTLTSFGTLVADIWAVLTASLVTVGSIGKLIVDNLNATISSRSTLTQAQILSDATPFAGANVDAAISSRATPAQVNTEVVDALAVDTYAEPTGVPPATSTLAQKLGRLYMALRNGLTVTATDKTFLDDGGAGEWKKPLSDDGVTYTEGEGTTP